jgi:hypothetical protein
MKLVTPRQSLARAHQRPFVGGCAVVGCELAAIPMTAAAIRRRGRSGIKRSRRLSFLTSTPWAAAS